MVKLKSKEAVFMSGDVLLVPQKVVNQQVDLYSKNHITRSKLNASYTYKMFLT